MLRNVSTFLHSQTWPFSLWKGLAYRSYFFNHVLCTLSLLQSILHKLCCAQSLSRVRLSATPWTIARQAPLSMGFPRQEYWSVWPIPSSGELPDPGIKQRSPALQVDSTRFSRITSRKLEFEKYPTTPNQNLVLFGTSDSHRGKTAFQQHLQAKMNC